MRKSRIASLRALAEGKKPAKDFNTDRLVFDLVNDEEFAEALWDAVEKALKGKSFGTSEHLGGSGPDAVEREWDVDVVRLDGFDSPSNDILLIAIDTKITSNEDTPRGRKRPDRFGPGETLDNEVKRDLLADVSRVLEPALQSVWRKFRPSEKIRVNDVDDEFTQIECEIL